MRGAFSLVRARWRAMLAAGSLLVLSAPVVPVHAATTGATETYIVLYKDGASSKSAASAVQGAGGQLVYNYQQIGVVIARSNRSDFAANMRAVAGIDGDGRGTGRDGQTSGPALRWLSAAASRRRRPLRRCWHEGRYSWSGPSGANSGLTIISNGMRRRSPLAKGWCERSRPCPAG